MSAHQVFARDCLNVLETLQEDLAGQVDVVVLDAPYGTARRGMDHLGYDDEMRVADWTAWLRPRLEAMRSTLSRHGVLLAFIGDERAHHLRLLLNEVFGSERAYLGSVILDHGTPPSTARFIGTQHDVVLVMAKSFDALRADRVTWREPKPGVQEVLDAAEKVWAESGRDAEVATALLAAWRRALPRNHSARKKGLVEYDSVQEGGTVVRRGPLGKPSPATSDAFRYDLLHPITGKPVPMPSTGWRWTQERMEKAVQEGRVIFGADETTPPAQAMPLSARGRPLPSVVTERRGAGARRLAELVPGASFAHPKDPTVLARLLKVCLPPGGLLLDPMAGSGTSVEAVASLGGGRRSILIEQDRDVVEQIIVPRAAALGVPLGSDEEPRTPVKS